MSTADSERPYADARALQELRQIRARLETARTDEAQLRRTRDALLVELAAQGVRYADLSKAAGLTPGRVAQLVSSARDAD